MTTDSTSTTEATRRDASACNEGLGVITRAEWERRYAARIRQRAGWTGEEAAEAARVGAIEHERNELESYGTVIWCGVTDARSTSPEDFADDEMSYWADDGEG